ncbi:MAG: hypothetical protein NTY35_15825 [Planctomycetota bacterium]|nr:hypothetical protein [Planctomycetota bacterium]
MRPTRLAAALLATAFLSTASFAGNGAPDAGSLLIFPCFDSTGPGFTAITITNTNNNFAPLGSNQYAGSVDVHFIYVNGDPIGNGTFYCQEFDTNLLLTPNDTVTVKSDLHNPSFDRGYLYVYARNPQTQAAISWNYLIGSAIQIAPETYYETNPFVFRSGRGLADGAPTDFSPADGIRNLDGVEYERVVDTLLVPHFFGQNTTGLGGNTGPNVDTELVLLNLSGAAQFSTIVNFLIYNDNENQFSAQLLFRCWTKRRLADINGVFTSQFLGNTSDAPGESILGLESGWYRINGGGGSSSADSLSNAAILGVQISTYAGKQTAVLPFTSGLNPNEGELISLSIFHD